MNPPAGNIGSARTAPAPARDDTRVQEPLPHYGPDQPGSVVGSYRPMHLPGRGGMGSVWLAERHDGQFRKQVALERVNTGAVEQADLRARFLQERQILASLQHPNIVALFDGGVVGDGRPFFALEYVDGRSVNAFCDDAGQEWNRVIANAPSDSVLAAKARAGLGTVHAQTSRANKAVREYDPSVATLRAQGVSQQKEPASVLIEQALALDIGDRPDAVIVALNDAGHILRALDPPLPALLGRALQQLGMNEPTLGNRSAAHDHLREAVTLLDSALGRDHRGALVARRMLADVIDDLGNTVNARRALELADLQRRHGSSCAAPRATLKRADAANPSAHLLSPRARRLRQQLLAL